MLGDKCNDMSLNVDDFIPGIAMPTFSTHHKTELITVETAEAKKGEAATRAAVSDVLELESEAGAGSQRP